MKVLRMSLKLAVVGLVSYHAAAATVADNRPLSPHERSLAIAPAAIGELRFAPTFASCSVKFGSGGGEVGRWQLVDGSVVESEGLRVEVEKVGGESNNRMSSTLNSQLSTLHYFADVCEYRGSLVELDEDTEYEVRLCCGGVERARGRFRTWASKVPVAKVVVLDPATVRFPVMVTDRGTPDGWIKYTAKGPLVNRGASDHFTVSNAAYVVFDDMELSGGSCGHVFSLERSENIRLRNLNIHGWGLVGAPSYTERDLGRIVRKPGAWAVGDQAVVIGRGMRNTVVERCWIHDQNSRSVAWYYSHPYGQNAVTMAFPEEGTVLRWNDFIGSDEHRWNDGVAGYGNFREDGGFHRDADIYGNYICFAGDDGVELDGGQQNVRCWNNRFDLSYTGVSVQGNTVSPSYVWRNWFGPCVDEFGMRGATIKTSGVAKGAKGDCVSYIWSNTLGGGGWGEPIALQRGVRFRLWDNLALHAEKAWVARKPGDGEGTVIAADTATPGAVKPGERPEMWPVRPLPFVLDRQGVDFGTNRAPIVVKAVWGEKVEKGGGGGESNNRMFSSTNYQLPTTNCQLHFEIAQNAAFDWFDVTPKSGTIGKDGVTFTVRHLNKPPTRRFQRGVFLVRTKDGLSRPCSVTAQTDYVPPVKCHKPGEYADYRESIRPGADGWYEATFDVPKRGTYYFLVRGTSGAPVAEGRARPELEVSVDGCAEERSVQQADTYPTWTMLTPGRKFGRMIRQYDFGPGKHTVRFRLVKNAFDIAALVLTDAPGSFERR